MVQCFGIIRPVLNVCSSTGLASVNLPVDVDTTSLAPNFVRAVLRVDLSQRLELLQRLIVLAAIAQDAAELQKSFRLVRVNCQRFPESICRLIVLTAALVNETELRLRVRVVRIDCCGLERPAESRRLRKPWPMFRKLPLKSQNPYNRKSGEATIPMIM